MLWLASRLTVWGTRLQCVAQQRAAARKYNTTVGNISC